jgi:predicted Zn-dependent peptidase
VVQEMIAEALWRDHPLGQPISGTPRTVGGMSREEILAFKDSRYVPANTVVAVAGRVAHDACVARAEALLGEWRRRRSPVCRKVDRAVRQARLQSEKKDIEQTHVALGFRVFGREDPRRFPLRVLSTVLGGNMSSRLFQVVREKHGLAYSIHATTHLFRETGALLVTAGLERHGGRKALDLIIREMRRLRERPVGRRELTRAKDYLVGQLRLSLESTTSQMMWIGDNLISRGRFLSPEATIESINAVSADDVQRLARQCFRHSRLSLAVVSPEASPEESRRVRRILRALA